MKKNNLIIIIITVISIVSLVLHFLPNYKERKIGYVKSPELIYGYIGTKEIQNKYNNQIKVYEAQLDTLQRDYQTSLNKYQLDYINLTEKERSERQQLLMHQENNLIKYKKDIEEKISKQEEEMMQGVLNQINSFVETYAKNNNYQIIFGTTNQGNILYAEEKIDLTKEILEKLNEQY